MQSAEETKTCSQLAETFWLGRPFRVALSFALKRAATEEERKELKGLSQISERLPLFREESLSFAILAYTKSSNALVFTAALFAKEALLTGLKASLFKARGLPKEKRSAIFSLLRSLYDLEPTEHLRKEEFLTLLSLLKEEKTPSLWKCEAECILEIAGLALSAFTLTKKRTFLLKKALTHLTDFALKNLQAAGLLGSPVRILVPNCSDRSAADKFETAIEVFEPLKSTVLKMLYEREAPPMVFGKLTVRENGEKKKALSFFWQGFEFSLPSLFDDDEIASFCGLVGSTLAASYRKPKEERFFILDNAVNRKVTEEDEDEVSLGHSPLGVFIPLEAMIKVNAFTERTLELLTLCNAVYAGESLTKKNPKEAIIRRYAADRDTSAINLVEGVIFLNHARGDLWHTSRAIARALRAEEKISQSLTAILAEPNPAATLVLPRLARAREELQWLLETQVSL